MSTHARLECLVSCQEGSGKQSPGARGAEAGGQVLRGGHMCQEPAVNTGTGSWRIRNFPKLTRKDWELQSRQDSFNRECWTRACRTQQDLQGLQNPFWLTRACRRDDYPRPRKELRVRSKQKNPDSHRSRHPEYHGAPCLAGGAHPDSTGEKWASICWRGICSLAAEPDSHLYKQVSRILFS